MHSEMWNEITYPFPNLLQALLLSQGPLLLTWFNTLRPRQNGRHFADDIFKCIFLNENLLMHNNPALVQIMAWRRSGDKPLSKPMIVKFTDAYMRHSASMS